jgi:two-component system phosphate regulon sensor histidine kinase PhoR
MIHRELTDPDDRELTGEVLAETDHMAAVLSDLLLIARLDAGKLTVKREPFDLASVLSETADRFRTRAAAADIRIAVEVTGKLRVHGDRERTSQILSILLDNALTYTPCGGSVAVVGSTQDSSAEILVEDTGPGISPKHLSRIFERFYRADTARSRSTGGTGLGLSIAQELARAQEGDLKAENAKEGGAVFRLKLPAG